MSTTNSTQNACMATQERRLNAVGWGLFFIWIGAALLTHLGWGVGLLGVGVITLGGQAARIHSGLRLDGFGIGVGVLFVVAGLCHLLGVQVDFTPLLCVIAGLTLLASAVVGRLRKRDGAPSPVD